LKPVPATMTSRSSKPCLRAAARIASAGLDHQQRLVAVQQVERRQRLVEVRRELFGPQLHGATPAP
jgi:hypothetical protein